MSAVYTWWADQLFGNSLGFTNDSTYNVYVKSLHSVGLEVINECRHASLLCIDEAMKRYIIPHHVHIGSHLAYVFLTYVFNGLVEEDIEPFRQEVKLKRQVCQE